MRRVCPNLQGFADAFGGRHLRYDPMDDSAYGAAVQDILGTTPDALARHRQRRRSGKLRQRFPVNLGEPNCILGCLRKFRSGDYRGSHIHFDPRYSMTAANADKWLPIAPGFRRLRCPRPWRGRSSKWELPVATLTV